jgi:hypothetical protein
VGGAGKLQFARMRHQKPYPLIIFFALDGTLLNHALAERLGAKEFLLRHQNLFKFTEQEFVQSSNLAGNCRKAYVVEKLFCYENTGNIAPRASDIKSLFNYFND